LTEKWAPCVPYVQLFCITGLLFPLHVINLNVLQALGRSDLFLRLEIIKKALIVINIAITWRWGINAMIYGMIVMSIISYYLNSYYTGVLLDYPFQEQLKDLFPYFSVAVLMGMALFAVILLPFQSYWFLLSAQITVGVVLYACLCRIFRLKAFMESWFEMRNRIKTAGFSMSRT
jgi:teichuronic acid exporter